MHSFQCLMNGSLSACCLGVRAGSSTAGGTDTANHSVHHLGSCQRCQDCPLPILGPPGRELAGEMMLVFTLLQLWQRI